MKHTCCVPLLWTSPFSASGKITHYSDIYHQFIMFILRLSHTVCVLIYGFFCSALYLRFIQVVSEVLSEILICISLRRESFHVSDLKIFILHKLFPVSMNGGSFYYGSLYM